MLSQLDIRSRCLASGVHLLICVCLASAASALVFGFWFPSYYSTVSGGRELFLLVTFCDLTLGPILTFAVFDATKNKKNLRRDLVVIGLLQISALVYGLHAVYIARPIAMVFEVDRFRVVVAADVYRPELNEALPQYRQLPLDGPWLLGTRAPRSVAESNSATLMGLQGIDIGDRPVFWRPYSESAPDALKRSRPLSMLMDHYPARRAEIDKVLAAQSVSKISARFLPLVAHGDWVVILNSSGDVRGCLPVDGFF